MPRATGIRTSLYSTEESKVKEYFSQRLPGEAFVTNSLGKPLQLQFKIGRAAGIVQGAFRIDIALFDQIK